MSETGSDALSLSFDSTKKGLRKSESGWSLLTPFLSNISSITFDAVSGDVTSSTVDTYYLVSGGVTGDVQATFTITYTDDTKSEVNKIEKT